MFVVWVCYFQRYYIIIELWRKCFCHCRGFTVPLVWWWWWLLLLHEQMMAMRMWSPMMKVIMLWCWKYFITRFTRNKWKIWRNIMSYFPQCLFTNVRLRLIILLTYFPTVLIVMMRMMTMILPKPCLASASVNLLDPFRHFISTFSTFESAQLSTRLFHVKCTVLRCYVVLEIETSGV